MVVLFQIQMVMDLMMKMMSVLMLKEIYVVVQIQIMTDSMIKKMSVKMLLELLKVAQMVIMMVLQIKMISVRMKLVFQKKMDVLWLESQRDQKLSTDGQVLMLIL